VHSINHVCIAVPDLEPARKFYSTFGLDVREKGNRLELYPQDGHCSAVIVEGPRKAMHYLSLGIFEDDVKAFQAHLKAKNVDLVAAPKGHESNGLWIRNNDGILIELTAMEKVSPNAKAPGIYNTVKGGERGAPFRKDAPLPKPRRLSHTLLFTPDVPASVRFNEEVLGLRLSDQAADGVAFTHGAHGSDHHLIAFAKSSAPGFHHFAWDVASMDDVGLGAENMMANGYTEGWGFGRHVLGSNYFYYVRDPWGSFSEYSFDIDYVPVDVDWEPLHTTPENGFYLWGPKVPDYFVQNHEAK